MRLRGSSFPACSSICHHQRPTALGSKPHIGINPLCPSSRTQPGPAPSHALPSSATVPELLPALPSVVPPSRSEPKHPFPQPLLDNPPHQPQPSTSQPQVAGASTALRPLPHNIPPVAREGTCVQVPYQTFLDLPSNAFWRLVTLDLVPVPERKAVAVFLACLDSVYRAEYQQLAAEAIAAISAANAAHVYPDGTVAERDLPAWSVWDAGERAAELAGAWPPPPPPPPPPAKGATATAATALGMDAGADSASDSGSASDNGSFLGMVSDLVLDNIDSSSGGDAEAEADAVPCIPAMTAAQLDARAVDQLLLLARRASFLQLTQRDTRLCDSLNADYLSQLFIKGSTGRLDTALVEPVLEDPSLPEDARAVLLLQRGYGREVAAGRLLLQKLDYLQTIAASKSGSWMWEGLQAAARALLGTFDFQGTPLQGEEQQQQEPEAGAGTSQQRQDLQQWQAWASMDSGDEVPEPEQPVVEPLPAHDPGRVPERTTAAMEPGAVLVPAESRSLASVDESSYGSGSGDDVGGSRALSPPGSAEGEDAGCDPAVLWSPVAALQALVASSGSAAAPCASCPEAATSSDVVSGVGGDDSNGSGARYASAAERNGAGSSSSSNSRSDGAGAGVSVCGTASDHAAEDGDASASSNGSPGVYGSSSSSSRRSAGNDSMRSGVRSGSTSSYVEPWIEGVRSRSSTSNGSGDGSSSASTSSEVQGSSSSYLESWVESMASACLQAAERVAGRLARAGRLFALPPRQQRQQQKLQEGGPGDAGGGGAGEGLLGGLPPGIEGPDWEALGAQLNGSMTEALRRFMCVLSDWGLVPRSDVLPLEQFNRYYPVRERPGRPPLYICKISLSDAIGGRVLGDGLRGVLASLWAQVQLQEPTFREVVVVWRAAASTQPRTSRGSSGSSGLATLAERSYSGISNAPTGLMAAAAASMGSGAVQAAAGVGGVGVGGGASARGALPRPKRRRGLKAGWLRELLLAGRLPWMLQEEEEAVKRPPIQIRIYREIPLPTWKVVLPEKLLQFRPLDLLRLDLFALAGLFGLLAQARYDNFLLDVVTWSSAAVLVVRILLGYQRMADRFRSSVNEVLADKGAASQEGAVEALATAAAEQQMRQAALAYLLLLHHCRAPAPPAARRQQRRQHAGQRAAAAAVRDAGSGTQPAEDTSAASISDSTGSAGIGSGVSSASWPGVVSDMQPQLRRAQVRVQRLLALQSAAHESLDEEEEDEQEVGPAGKGEGQGQGSSSAGSSGSSGFEGALARLPGTARDQLKAASQALQTLIGLGQQASNNGNSSSAAPSRGNGNGSYAATHADGGEDAAHISLATSSQVQELAELALAHYSGTRVRFNACEALAELERLGLVVRVQPHSHERDSAADSLHSGNGGGAALPGAGCVGECMGHQDQLVAGPGGRPVQCGSVWWAAVPLQDAVPVIEEHWAGLLWRRVGGILQGDTPRQSGA